MRTAQQCKTRGLKHDVREVEDSGDAVLQIEGPYSDQVDAEEDGKTAGVKLDEQSSSDQLPAGLANSAKMPCGRTIRTTIKITHATMFL